MSTHIPQRLDNQIEPVLPQGANPLQNNPAELIHPKPDNQTSSAAVVTKATRFHNFDQTCFSDLLQEYNLSSTAP